MVKIPDTTAIEVDVLAEDADADNCWAVVFENKKLRAKAFLIIIHPEKDNHKKILLLT